MDPAPPLTGLSIVLAPVGLAMPVALLDISPGDFTEKTGVRFVAGRDDLDDLAAALVKTRDGLVFGLVYHLHAPVKGIEVLLGERSSSWERERESILAIMTALGIRTLWLRPDGPADLLS